MATILADNSSQVESSWGRDVVGDLQRGEKRGNSEIG